MFRPLFLLFASGLLFQAASGQTLVELYYESLCPYCKEFINNQLYPTFVKLQNTDVMTVATYPYGNAQYNQLANGTWEFECQHGPKECALNIVFACIMAKVDNKVEKYLPVVDCIERNTASVKECVEKTIPEVDYNDVEVCSLGAEGNELLHQFAVLTDNLVPPHRYVPHIVIDGVHDEQLQDLAQTDLLKFVCEMYSGEKPEACLVF